MDRKDILALLQEAFTETQGNSVLVEDKEMTILEQPLVGFVSAADPIFDDFKKPEVIGPNFRKPTEYMEDAKTVMAFFFPFTEEIRKGHEEGKGFTDPYWTNGYPAGNVFCADVILKFMDKLEARGIHTLQPEKAQDNTTERTAVHGEGREDAHFSVSWSTRHACYASGLGTFGVHRHIITEKGCCGTLGSLIISEPVEATVKDYTGPYDYCTFCGACAERCPAGAITVEHLRNIRLCADHSGRIRESGLQGSCGKCLVGVPCEAQRPIKEK